MMEHQFLSLTGICLLSSTLLGLVVFSCRKLDEKTNEKPEPYHVPSVVPYLGHLIGIIWYRNRYYTKISAKYNKLPIYTLPVLKGQIYVINEPDLVVAAQRQPKIISFWQVEAMSITTLGAISTSGSKKLKNIPSHVHQAEKVQGQGLLLDGLSATHRAMAPGLGFQEMLLAAREPIAEALNALAGRITAQVHVDMWQWVKHEVTHATTESVYGPMNPYRDLAVENGFWDFSDNVMWLMSGPTLSKILASKGCEGRATVIAAFLEYFRKNGHESGSALVKARVKVMKRELPQSDIAALECVNGQAILVNSVPTAFWTLWQVYSNDEILHAVRGEVDAITRFKDGWKTISLPTVTNLPILESTMQETLRYRSCGVGPRMVLEDTVLESKHHLRKGSYVMFDNRSLHLHKPTWGSDSEDFNMRRFIKPIDRRRIQRSSAFRGFGGGANLCPGKDFASLEIMAFVAMFVARFDMIPDKGRWENLQQDLSNVALAISPPASKVFVQIVERESLGGLKWKFED